MNEEETTQSATTKVVEAILVNDKFEVVKKIWASFHNSIIIALVFTLLGIGIGVQVSKDYYRQKLSDVVVTGAMLFDKKVYTITPKL